MRLIEDRIHARLAALDRDSLRRTLRPPSGIDLSSNDYLGLSRHPAIQQSMAEAALCEGVGSTGSRLLRGERDAFRECEARFARFKGVERALYFSSGYLANIAVLSTLCEAGDTIFSDERNHASLIDGMRLSRAKRVVFPHNDVTALARLMEADAAARKFVVTESLFSMDGDFAPLTQLGDLCRSHDAALIVDEAHAVGVYGPGLAGREAFLTINTAGKALGVCGAFVAGSSDTIEALIQFSRPFIFSTAAPPCVADALLAAMDVIESEPARRARLASYVRLMGAESHIIPVIIGENDAAVAAAAELQKQGFDVRAIRPPAVPQGSARLRISLNSEIPESDLRRFSAALEECLTVCS